MISLAAPAAAATVIPGGALNSQTWTASASPYIVEGDLYIAPGFILDVHPGVVVQMAKPGITIDVAGTLNVEGLPGLPATFTAPAGEPGSWNGIRITTGADVRLDHVVLEYATIAVDVQGAGPFASTGLTVRDAALYSMRIEGGVLELDRFASSGAIRGVVVAGASARFTNCLVVGDTEAGSAGGFLVQPDGPASTEYASLDLVNCTISGHAGDGVHADAGAGTVDTLIVNTIIAHNDGFGILATSDGGYANVDLTYSALHRNQAGELEGVLEGQGVIFEDPKLDAPTSPGLDKGSPCVDSGNSNLAPDHDLLGNPRPVDGDGNGRATADMGAYEVRA